MDGGWVVYLFFVSVSNDWNYFFLRIFTLQSFKKASFLQWILYTIIWQMLAKLASAMHKPAQQTVVQASAVKDLLASLPVKKM